MTQIYIFCTIFTILFLFLGHCDQQKRPSSFQRPPGNSLKGQKVLIENAVDKEEIGVGAAEITPNSVTSTAGKLSIDKR